MLNHHRLLVFCSCSVYIGYGGPYNRKNLLFYVLQEQLHDVMFRVVCVWCKRILDLFWGKIPERSLDNFSGIMSLNLGGICFQSNVCKLFLARDLAAVRILSE